MTLLLIAGGLAAPTAPLYPGVGAIFKGPDSETIIKGPDGSRITSLAEGAALTTEEKLEPIVGPAPFGNFELEKAPEEVVEIAEEAVADFPKSDAVIIALQEPEALPIPEQPLKYDVSELLPEYVPLKVAHEKTEYEEPFIIKAY